MLKIAEYSIDPNVKLRTWGEGHSYFWEQISRKIGQRVKSIRNNLSMFVENNLKQTKMSK